MYKALKLSLLRFIRSEVSGFSFPTAVIDLDGHSNIQELPNSDVVALDGLVVSDLGEMHGATFSITCITYQDENVMRLTDLVDHFSKALKPGSQVNVYNEALDVVAKIQTIPTVSTSSVSRAEVRAVISVVVDAKVIPLG